MYSHPHKHKQHFQLPIPSVTQDFNTRLFREGKSDRGRDLLEQKWWPGGGGGGGGGGGEQNG